MAFDFELWNGTSVAHLFCRLITKTNHPYDERILTREEFDKDYRMMRDYIEWKRNRQINYLLYKYTDENLTTLLNMIDYDTENRSIFSEYWKRNMVGIV